MDIYTRGVRGAITLNKDTKDDIKIAVVELLEKMLKENEIKKEDIAFAIFTTTQDIKADFPAKHARIELGFESIPMMCYNEAQVKDSLELCLRVLLTINTTKKQNEIKHIYLKGASILREDLSR